MPAMAAMVVQRPREIVKEAITAVPAVTVMDAVPAAIAAALMSMIVAITIFLQSLILIPTPMVAVLRRKDKREGMRQRVLLLRENLISLPVNRAITRTGQSPSRPH
jgi:hypothetical protein